MSKLPFRRQAPPSRTTFIQTRHRTRWPVSAVAPLVATALPVLMAGTSHAACTVSGSGSLGALNANDIATCTGLGNTDTITTNGSTNVEVRIGDGTPTSLVPAGNVPAIAYLATSHSRLIVNGQAQVSAYGGIVLTGNANNNQITVAAGGTVNATGNNESAILIDGSHGNTLDIRGSVTAASTTNGVRLSGDSSSNVITVQQGGSIASGAPGVLFAGGNGNALVNKGSVTSSFDYGVFGSSSDDIVVTSGTISGGPGAVALGYGNDSLTLEAGWSMTGRVLGGDLVDTLKFGGSVNASFDLGLLGTGLQYDEFEQLAKIGSSTWTLTGTTAFNGAMTVEAGGLLVNGTLPSIVTVNGGFVGGSGTIGGLIVNSGGSAAPGNSIGTLNVSGNVAFNAGSVYRVEINPAGQADRIAATGTATLNGGTVQVTALGAGYLANTQYTILSAAGGVSGTFGALASSGGPLVTGSLSYDANNVYLLLQQVGGFSTLTGLTPNQGAVAAALDQAQTVSTSGALTGAINTLAPLGSSGIKAGLDDLAGQIHADQRRATVDQADMFQTFMWNAGTQARGEAVRVPASAYAAEPADPIGKASGRRAAPVQSVWFGGYGNWDKVSSSANAFGTSSNVAGAALGVDVWRTPTLTVGFAAGASTGRLALAGRADSVDSNAAHGGLYARGESGGFHVASAISYSFAALESARRIGFLGETATASSRAHTFAASLGIARPFEMGWGLTAEPFVKVDWYTARQGAFTETGAPGLNQLVRSGGYDTAFGTAGVRALQRVNMPGGQAAQVGATLAVRHESGGAPSMTTALDGAPGIPFVITGIDRARTVALAGAEARWDLTATTSFKASYEGAFAPGYDRHTLKGLLRSEF